LSLSILLDQNIPIAVGDYLRTERPQWTVRHVRDIGLSGASDAAIFQRAQQDGAIVITFDEDFADTRMYPIGGHAGVIRLRVWPTTVEVTEAALGRLLATTQDEALPGSLIIIDNAKIRIRRTARHG
jgi:predicted nuclease of predicted toxin-antitoxin system